MTYIHDGASAPKQFSLPLGGFPFPTYPDAELYGHNCEIWHQFYVGFAERFLAGPSYDNGCDVRIAHAGLLSALDTAGMKTPEKESERVWRLIERLSR
mgnify:CR=1 FL=1